MNTPTILPEAVNPQNTARRENRGAAWVLMLLPLLALGVVLAYLVVTGGGLKDLIGPPVEQLKVQRIVLPKPGVI